MKEKDLRIDELRIVRMIAETASVSKAAQLLDMPQQSSFIHVYAAYDVCFIIVASWSMLTKNNLHGENQTKFQIRNSFS